MLHRRPGTRARRCSSHGGFNISLYRVTPQRWKLVHKIGRQISRDFHNNGPFCCKCVCVCVCERRSPRVCGVNQNTATRTGLDQHLLGAVRMVMKLHLPPFAEHRSRRLLHYHSAWIPAVPDIKTATQSHAPDPTSKTTGNRVSGIQHLLGGPDPLLDPLLRWPRRPIFAYIELHILQMTSCTVCHRKWGPGMKDWPEN